MMRFNKAALAFCLFLLQSPAVDAAGTCTLEIVNSRGEIVTLSVEIAATDAEREQGLMYRQSMADDAGMLFVFEYEHIMGFWMKNTLLPLSIAYIDRGGVIRELYDMKPLDASVTYPSREPAMYALEVNAGWFERHGVGRGSRVRVHGCLGQ
jgi:uncharacterized protein